MVVFFSPGLAGWLRNARTQEPLSGKHWRAGKNCCFFFFYPFYRSSFRAHAYRRVLCCVLCLGAGDGGGYAECCLLLFGAGAGVRCVLLPAVVATNLTAARFSLFGRTGRYCDAFFVFLKERPSMTPFICLCVVYFGKAEKISGYDAKMPE